MTRILIIDDERACRNSLRMLLSLEGFEVEVAADEEVAVKIVGQFQPHLLIVDWMLCDGVDGLQLAKTLASGSGPEQTISVQTIMVTGYPADELEPQMESLPNCQFLPKPFKAADMIKAIRTAVQRLS